MLKRGLIPKREPKREPGLTREPILKRVRRLHPRVVRWGALGVGALVVVAGLTAAGRWNDHRMAACTHRGTALAALDVLSARPTGFRPTLEPYAGCDVDRVVAYAGRQFVPVDSGPSVDTLATASPGSPVAQAPIVAFYRDALQSAGWRLTPSATLAATKSLPSGTARFALSFPLPSTYQLDVSDA